MAEGKRKLAPLPETDAETGEERPDGVAETEPGAPPGASPEQVAALGRRAGETLDRLIHERVRLGIVSVLAVHDSLTFNDLKSLLGTSDGNLSVHARKLEEAGYLTSEKSFVGRVPRTAFQLTASGRRALERYLGHMEALIRATRSSRTDG